MPKLPLVKRRCLRSTCLAFLVRAPLVLEGASLLAMNWSHSRIVFKHWWRGHHNWVSC